MTETEQSIWDAIRASNAAWFGGEPDRVADLFHDDVVLLTTEFTHTTRLLFESGYIVYDVMLASLITISHYYFRLMRL